MVLLQIKPKIMVLVAMDGNHKLTMVCFVLIIVYKEVLKGSYDAISSFPFSLECYKLFVMALFYCQMSRAHFCSAKVD